MKKQLLTLFCAAFLIAFSTDAFAQSCRLNDVASIPVPPATCAAIDGSNAAALEVTDYSFSSNDLPDYQLVITAPYVDQLYDQEGNPRLDDDGNPEGGEKIFGLTYDGTFDFSGAEPGEYKVVPFAYDQAELNALAELINPLAGVIGIPVIELPAELSSVLATISEVLGELTISDVEGAICEFLPGLGPNFGTAEDPIITYDVGDEQGEYYTLTVMESCPVGINDFDQLSFGIASIVPVPAVDFVSINLNNNSYANFEVAVYDLTGKMIQNTNIQQNDFTLDVSTYSAGMYFISISNEEGAVNSKFYVR